jgi:hypothetical protein
MTHQVTTAARAMTRRAKAPGWFARRMPGVPSQDSDAPAPSGSLQIRHPRVAHMDPSTQIIDDAIAANRILPGTLLPAHVVRRRGSKAPR